MKTQTTSIATSALRRGRLALLRFALREIGCLLSASAPLVVRGGERLQHLSQHPSLASPPGNSK